MKYIGNAITSATVAIRTLLILCQIEEPINECFLFFLIILLADNFKICIYLNFNTIKEKRSNFA